MAEGKKSFVAYCDWGEIFDVLTNEKAGKLAKHLFDYVRDRNPKSDETTELLFISIRQSLKRDLVKYNKFIEKQKNNGSKGGRPKKPKKAKPFLENPTEPKKADNDNDSDNDIIITLKEEDFNRYAGYVKQLSGENYRIEGYYRTYKLKKGSLTGLTELFINHLKMFPKNHKDYNTFIRHFGSWLGLQDRNGQLNNFKEKVKGQL